MKLSILVAALPIPVIFLRTKPSEKGLLPLGAEMSDEEIAAAEKKSGHSLSEVNIAVGWKVLRKHAGFWLLVSGFLFVGVINSAVSVNMVSNMTSVNSNGAEVVTGGHSVVWAGYVMSLYMGVVLVAKVVLGWIFDRFGITGGVLVLLPAGMYFPVLPNNLLGSDPRSRMLRCRYLHGNHRTVHHDFA
nr:MFS transporter [Bifidobacterium catenulatum]